MFSFNTVVGSIQILLLVCLFAYVVLGCTQLYFEFVDPDVIKSHNSEMSKKFALKYTRRPIWNSFWVWALCKCFDFFWVGCLLKLGPFQGIWQSPLYILGLVFMVYHEFVPRSMVWEQQS
jgi:protein-S-isoprenylcysteine O-methyltransferase Ste14